MIIARDEISKVRGMFMSRWEKIERKGSMIEIKTGNPGGHERKLTIQELKDIDYPVLLRCVAVEEKEEMAIVILATSFLVASLDESLPPYQLMLQGVILKREEREEKEVTESSSFQFWYRVGDYIKLDIIDSLAWDIFTYSKTISLKNKLSLIKK